MEYALSRRAELAARLAEAGVVDTHYHVGPELLPRRYHVESLARAAQPWNATVVLKNHTYATTPLASLARAVYGVQFLGSVVLNRFVGGLSPDAIHSAMSGNKADPTRQSPDELPIVVWLPTVHARAHLEHFGYDFDPRWSGCCAHSHGEPHRHTSGRKPTERVRVQPISAYHNERPTPELVAVLEAVASYGARACLATGHLSAAEVLALVPLALKIGVHRVIVTHPHYPCVGLDESALKRLVSDDRVFIEHCFAIHTIEEVSMQALASAIRATGPEQVVLSTDFGQIHSEPFPDGTVSYALALREALSGAISDEWLVAMFSDNGRKALGLR